MFRFEEDYTLKGKIVELYPLQKTHEPDLFKESNHKDIWEHFTENGFGKLNFSKYIDNAISKRYEGQQYPLIIKDVRTDQVAGMTRIYDVSNDLKNVKLGHTWIGKQYQGTGLNRACKYLLFEFLFEKIGMERIGFGASSLNHKSIKAMQNVGCIIEGKLRGFLPIKDSKKRADIILLSILREEWLDRSD